MAVGKDKKRIMITLNKTEAELLEQLSKKTGFSQARLLSFILVLCKDEFLKKIEVLSNGSIK